MSKLKRLLSVFVLSAGLIAASLLVLAGGVNAIATYWYYSDGSTTNVSNSLFTDVGLVGLADEGGAYWRTTNSSIGYVTVTADDPPYLFEGYPDFIELVFRIEWEAYHPEVSATRVRILGNWFGTGEQTAGCNPVPPLNCALNEWHSRVFTMTGDIANEAPPDFSPPILRLSGTGATNIRIRNIRWCLISIDGEQVTACVPAQVEICYTVENAHFDTEDGWQLFNSATITNSSLILSAVDYATTVITPTPNTIYDVSMIATGTTTGTDSVMVEFVTAGVTNTLEISDTDTYTTTLTSGSSTTETLRVIGINGTVEIDFICLSANTFGGTYGECLENLIPNGTFDTPDEWVYINGASHNDVDLNAWLPGQGQTVNVASDPSFEVGVGQVDENDPNECIDISQSDAYARTGEYSLLFEFSCDTAPTTAYMDYNGSLPDLIYTFGFWYRSPNSAEFRAEIRPHRVGSPDPFVQSGVIVATDEWQFVAISFDDPPDDVDYIRFFLTTGDHSDSGDLYIDDVIIIESPLLENTPGVGRPSLAGTPPALAPDEYLILQFEARAVNDGYGLITARYRNDSLTNTITSTNVFEVNSEFYTFQTDFSNFGDDSSNIEIGFFNTSYPDSGAITQTMNGIFVDNVCLMVSTQPITLPTQAPGYLYNPLGVTCSNVSEWLSDTIGIDFPALEAMEQPGIWDPEDWVPWLASRLWVHVAKPVICILLALFENATGMSFLNWLAWFIRQPDRVLAWFADLVAITLADLGAWLLWFVSPLLLFVNLIMFALSDFRGFLAWLGAVVSWLWDALVLVFFWIVGYYIGWAISILNLLIAAWNSILPTVSSVLSGMVNAGMSIWNNHLAPFLSRFGNVYEFVIFFLAQFGLVGQLLIYFFATMWGFVIMIWGFFTGAAELPVAFYYAFNNAVNDPAFELVPACAGDPENYWCIILAGLVVVDQSIAHSVGYPLVIVAIIVGTVMIFWRHVMKLVSFI